MKRIIMIILVMIPGSMLQAQTIIKKEIPLEGENRISVELPYANTIELNSAKNNEFYLKASVSIDKGKRDHTFKIKTKRRLNTLYIKSVYKDVFKEDSGFFNFFSDKDRSIRIDKQNGRNGITINNITIKIDYVLYIPENVVMILNSTSGDVMVNSFKGNLTADITSGDILVNDYNGNLTLETVSGAIHIKIRNASTLIAETTIGKIIKKAYIPKLIIKERLVGGYAKANFKKGKYSINLSTVSGNIHLEK